MLSKNDKRSFFKMRKVKVITDSCADLSAELLKKYDLDYAKMSTVLDGEVTPALLEWTPDEVHAFYSLMREGKRITTSQVTAEEFYRIFPIYLDKGCDIVYVGCSLKQSGSVNTGHMVADKLLEKYPDAKIFCIDSQNSSIGEGILAIEAAKLAAEGLSAEEIAEHIISVRKTVNEYVTVHTLDFLRRAGRVTATSAFFGNLIGVKPIIIADAVGAQTAVKKVKGRQNSISEIVNMLAKSIVDPENQTVYVVHADCSEEEVSLLVDAVKEKIPCKDVSVGYIGPIVGASIGPDAVGVFAFGSKVTYAGAEK